MSAVAIAAERVSVEFNGVAVVTDVSLSVAPGERRALIGPNGAGKTTLFNVLDGHIQPTAGRVRLLGEDASGLSVHARSRAGLGRTYQITNLLAGLSVKENVLLAVGAAQPSVRRRFWTPLAKNAGVQERAEELLRSWDLWSVRSVAVGELAYGQQRVLEIIMALSADPQVLLLDEPTAGLSKRDAETLTDVTDELPKSLAILMIEHDMDIAFRLCSSITVLAEGRVLEEGTPDQIKSSLAVIETYLGGDYAA